MECMIVEYGLHGQGQEEIDLYQVTKQARFQPKDVNFLGLLAACNHSGLLELGWDYFTT